MADKKISALTGATTPLAGTEVLPIVQSGATVKVAVSDLTAGRAVSALSLSCTSTISTTISSKTAAFDAAGGSIYSTFDDATTNWRIGTGIQAAGKFSLYAVTGAVNAFTVDTSGNLSLGVGNLVMATSGKGIDFSATPGTGTSELLADYEEGTWTPSTAFATFVGAASSSGTYTKVGRQVSINGILTGATSVSVGASGILTTDLPFTTAAFNSIGSMAASTNTADGVIRVTGIYIVATTTMAATGSITFTATYFV
jgi:hypothetical protein